MIPIAQWLSELTYGHIGFAIPTAEPPASSTAAMESVAETPCHDMANAQYERGLREGRELAADEHERRISELEEAHLRDLEILHAQRASEDGDRLGEAFRRAFDELETAWTESISAILRPFLRKAVRERALEGFKNDCLAFFRSGQRKALTVTGPPDLISRLRADGRLTELPIEFVEGTSVEVAARADETEFATRISEWIRDIDGIDGEQL